jgi:hypothetical protein
MLAHALQAEKPYDDIPAWPERDDLMDLYKNPEADR